MKTIEDFKHDFGNQRVQARRRHIEWALTFDAWLAWWISTGHLHQRGRRRDDYVMSRFNDEGPYALSNIECKTRNENSIEGCRTARAKGTWGTNAGNYSLKKKKSA